VERAMAEQLVAAMTESFDPAAHRDDYRDALMAIIDAKVSGRQTVVPEAVAEGGTVIDLMAALEASVAAARAARVAASEPAGTPEALPVPVAVSEPAAGAPEALPVPVPVAAARGARRRKTA